MIKNNKDLLRAMSDIEDKYIQEVLSEDLDNAPKVVEISGSRRKFRKRIWSIVAIAAACILGFAAINVLDFGVKPSYESSTSEQAFEETAQSYEEVGETEEAQEEESEAMYETDSAKDEAYEPEMAANEATQSDIEGVAQEDTYEAAQDDANEASQADIYEAEIPKLGLSLKVSSPSSKGARLVWIQTGADIIGTIEVSDKYRLEKYDGSYWVAVKVQDEDAFEDSKSSITVGDNTLYELNWEQQYGSLLAGTYRIIMTVNNVKDSSSTDTYEIAAEFVIE